MATLVLYRSVKVSKCRFIKRNYVNTSNVLTLRMFSEPLTHLSSLTVIGIIPFFQTFQHLLSQTNFFHVITTTHASDIVLKATSNIL